MSCPVLELRGIRKSFHSRLIARHDVGRGFFSRIHARMSCLIARNKGASDVDMTTLVDRAQIDDAEIHEEDINDALISGIDLQVNRGEVVCIMGKSGSGKSTLLHIAGLLDICDDGDVLIDGVKCSELSDAEKTVMRRNNISFVYQFHHLMLEFNVLENLLLPQMIRGVNGAEAKSNVVEILRDLHMLDKIYADISSLSGGERQRVAIARALVVDSPIILADEPTGSLDPTNACRVFEAFNELARSKNRALLLVTHDIKMAEYCDKAFLLNRTLRSID